MGLNKQMRRVFRKIVTEIHDSLSNLGFTRKIRATAAHNLSRRQRRIQIATARYDSLTPIVFGFEKGIENAEKLTTEEIDVACHYNTGNFAFLYAIDKLLGGDLPVYSRTGEVLPPAGSIGVVPCANMIGSHRDMGFMYEWQRRHDVPMVAIGLGAQSDRETAQHCYSIPKIPRGTKNWLRSLVDHAVSKAPNISLRGEFSLRVMESMGLEDHAVVLGCPTLFIHPDPHLGQRIARNI